jgi:hypothetical protein
MVFEQCRIMVKVETEGLVKKEPIIDCCVFCMSLYTLYDAMTSSMSIFLLYTQGVFHPFMEGVTSGYTRNVHTHWSTGLNSYSGLVFPCFHEMNCQFTCTIMISDYSKAHFLVQRI